MDIEQLPPVEQEAIRWVVRMTSGEATESDRLAFRNWRARNPENESALVMARSLWVSLDLGLAKPGAPDSRRRLWRGFDGRMVAAQRRGRRLMRAAVAASLVAASLLGYRTLHDWRYDDVTHPGERRQITLSDGSHVEMNIDTALSVDFVPGYRRVTLARGEAYFDVTHDAERPFLVRAGRAEVQVLGTAFSVRREGDGAIVTVARGRVQVSDGSTSVVVTPEQQVSYTEGRHAPVKAVDTYDTLGWRRGRLVIQDESLRQIVQELNRYYPGRIVLTADIAGEKLLNAVIDLDHIDDWIKALAESQPVKVSQFGPLTWIR
jgi:transmembrane sensor